MQQYGIIKKHVHYRRLNYRMRIQAVLFSFSKDVLYCSSLCAKAESSISCGFILIDSIIARFEGELQSFFHPIVSNETSLILLSRYLDAIQRWKTLMIAHAELNEIMCYHRRSIGLTLIRGLLLYTGTSHGCELKRLIMLPSLLGRPYREGA